MQIVSLELNHLNFYCPATGEVILDSEHCNDNAKSLMGYWVNEDFYLPMFNNKALEIEFKNYLKQQELSDDFTLESETLEQFIKQYDEKNWVCFKITTGGIGCGGPMYSTVYMVIDMDTTVS